MKIFGTCKDGLTAHLYTIENTRGMAALVSDFGAALVSLFVQTKVGSLSDVVLGFDTLEEYEENPPHLGTTIGRYANRIVRGRFTLEGRQYSLELNNGVNHLHGGFHGFDKRLWTACQTAKNSIRFALFSPDMDQGYPGNLVVSVTYTLTEDNALCLSYSGMSDKTTLLNLTNHTYFNLAGQESDSALGHYLRINADRIAAVDANSSVTGEMMDVSNTPFDFRAGKQIGAEIGSPHMQLEWTHGYDHHYFLCSSCAAEAYCEESGICMTVYTDSPGVQFYTANHLDDSLILKSGSRAKKHRAFCLETQHAPDAMNQPAFGDDPVLPAGICKSHETRYVFSAHRPSWI